MDLDAVVESVGVGLVEPEIVISGQRVVDALEGDLVLGVVHVDLVVRSVLAVEVTEVVAELVGGVVDEIGHLVVVDSDDGLVQVGGKTAGGDAFIAVSTAGDLVLAALGVLPLGAEGGGGLIFAAGPLGLFLKFSVLNDKTTDNYFFSLLTYGKGNLAIISARLAETELENRVAFVVVFNEFLALEDQVVGELTLEFSAEDKVVVISGNFTALLHHEATTVGALVHCVGDGRTVTAGLDSSGFTGEFKGVVERVTGGVSQGLEDVLELLRVPFLVGFLVPLLASGLDLVTKDGVEEGLDDQVGGQRSLELGVGLGGCR